LALVESSDWQGSGPPLHVHENEDEGYYVLEGEHTFFVGEQAIEASTGTWVFGPRRVPHTYRCESSEGRHLFFIMPGGFEGFYAEAGESGRPASAAACGTSGHRAAVSFGCTIRSVDRGTSPTGRRLTTALQRCIPAGC
jgi:hypothetical protein